MFILKYPDNPQQSQNPFSSLPSNFKNAAGDTESMLRANLETKLFMLMNGCTENMMYFMGTYFLIREFRST